MCRSGWAFYGFTGLVHGGLLEMNLGTSQRARKNLIKNFIIFLEIILSQIARL